MYLAYSRGLLCRRSTARLSILVLLQGSVVDCVRQPRNPLCELDLLWLFYCQTCMKRSRRRSRCCPNPDCAFKGQSGKGNIIRHSFYITTQGRRRRYRCKECGRTFSSTHGTPYYRLHKPRSLFDEVVHMCVHGIGISAMARMAKQLFFCNLTESDLRSDSPVV